MFKLFKKVINLKALTLSMLALLTESYFHKAKKAALGATLQVFYLKAEKSWAVIPEQWKGKG